MTADELREARDALAATVERFARAEIAPHVTAWDAAGEFPRALHRRAADLGLLGLGYPEAYGGTPAPHALRLPVWVALCRYGASGGVLASLLSHNIGLPPVLALGSEDVKREVIPPVLAGERIAALAITEPGGGSDVAALRTTARRDGDDYVVDGEKIFITSGMRADWITVAVRTGDGRGAKDISLLLVPGDSQGLSRTRLDKMGWLCSDTAHLRFDWRARAGALPAGRRGRGLQGHHGQFQRRALWHRLRRAGLFHGLRRRGAGLGAAASDLWQPTGRPPGGAPQARRHAAAHPIHIGLAGAGGRGRRRGRHRGRLGR